MLLHNTSWVQVVLTITAGMTCASYYLVCVLFWHCVIIISSNAATVRDDRTSARVEAKPLGAAGVQMYCCA